jgi:hypothetical protein
MKKQLFAGLIGAVIFSSTACTTERVVAVQPEPPVIVARPAPPPGEHLYVDYEYRWKGGKYVAVPGYYIKKKPGRTWIPGKWEKKEKGYVWIGGHWK